MPETRSGKAQAADAAAETQRSIMPEHVVHTIEPVFDENSRVLVLGSVPSPQSRKEGFFYGHPQNRFWRVLASVFDEPVPTSVADKRDLLLRRHIALWDVVRCCDIEGASDASIKNAEPNDLARIFDAADIRAVFCTGAKAGALYARLRERRFDMPCVVLPSTSPANAKETVESLSRAYAEALLRHLRPFEPPVLNVEEVVALERRLEKNGTPLADLMQRAGRALAQETMRLVEQRGKEGFAPKGVQGGCAGGRLERKDRAHEEAPGAASRNGARPERPARNDAPGASDGRMRPSCVVLCGAGNNGGDGWVAAAELAAAEYDVTVASPVEPEDIETQPARDAALRAAEALRSNPHAHLLVDPRAAQLESALDGAFAIVDAMLGTGFAGATVRPPFDAWIKAANNRRANGALVVAADVPSGLNAQTGKAAQPCIKADSTVTMIAGKPGLFTPYAFAFCGRVRIAPIAYIEPLIGRSDGAAADGRAQAQAGKDIVRTANGKRLAPLDDMASDTDDQTKNGPRSVQTRAIRPCPDAQASKSASRASNAHNGEFLRAEAEDDDGYDPYSDRRPDPEPLFEQDPWS